MRPSVALTCAVLVPAWMVAAVCGVGLEATAQIADHGFSGRVSLEGRWYPQSGAFPGQSAHASGLAAEAEFYLEDADGRGVTLTPFFRYDSADPRRTHVDLREAYLLLLGRIGNDEWELRLGVDRVFWGVAESRHLVDIINQTDLIEHPDEEDKLGQPLAHLTWTGDWGVAEVFGLPYHRARTFAGPQGRLRFPLVADDENPLYESPAKQWHFDVAARYSHSLGLLDIGASVFNGTSREPFMRPALNSGGVPILRPYYEQIPAVGPGRPTHARCLAAQAGSHPAVRGAEPPGRGTELRRAGHRGRIHVLFGMGIDRRRQPSGGMELRWARPERDHCLR